MEKNYTPLNLEKLSADKQKGSKIHTVLIVIAIITALVLAFILIVLIQRAKPSSSVNPQSPVVVPAELPSSTPEASPSALPIPSISEVATPSSTINPSP